MHECMHGVKWKNLVPDWHPHLNFVQFHYATTLRELNSISHSQRDLTRSEKLFCYNRWNVNWIAVVQLHDERRNKQLLITAEKSQLSVSDLTNWANSIISYELISSDLLLYYWIIEYRTDSKTFRHDHRGKKVGCVSQAAELTTWRICEYHRNCISFSR